MTDNSKTPFSEYVIERALSEPPISILPGNMPIDALKELAKLHVKDISKIYQLCIVLEMINQGNAQAEVSEDRIDALSDIYISHVMAEIKNREAEAKEEPATLDRIFKDLDIYLAHA